MSGYNLIMAKRKSFLGLKFTYDAPATLSLAVICILLFAVRFLLADNQLFSLLLSSPTAAGGTSPFAASSFLSYIKLFLYVFGENNNQILVCNVIFILLLGPSMEERYGTVVIGIMMLVTSLFAGVLNACFCKYPLTGCSAIVFMMIFLNSFMSLSKKKIPFSFVLVFVLYILKEYFDKSAAGRSNDYIVIIINIAGGLCGSLFAFLTSPKARTAKKAECADATVEADSGKTGGFFRKGGLLNRANEYAEGKKTSFFKRKSAKSDSNNSDATVEETVVGTLHFDD